MDVFHSARVSLILAFMALPLVLASFTGFLALALGNLGLFVLFLGQAILIPFVTMGIHFIMGLATVGGFKGLIDDTGVGNDIKQLIPSEPYTGSVNTIPSYWSMHVIFFLTYLLTNAIKIYKLPVAEGASDWQVANRRSKAVAVIIVVVLSLIALPLIRYSFTGAERAAGLLLAFPAAGLLGWGWYELASKCGARHSDVFGIIQQILPSSTGTAMTCVYTPSA